MHRRCTRILHDETRAEDVLHEAFLRVWKYGASYRDAKSKLGWLYRVVDRCCFDELARQARHREETAQGQKPTHVRSHEGRIADRELVLQVLDHFDERVKQVAVLYYLDGLTQEEIAKNTGWSRQTIAKKLSQLKRHAASIRLELSNSAAK